MDKNLEVHEEFIGLYECANITVDTIVKVLKDTLLRLNLQLSRCRGQCYDGGSNMAGSKNGVKAQILREEPRALFTHCYGHALSLSVADTVRMVKCLGSTMDTVHELSKLLQYSPKRSALFKDLKAEISPDTVGFRILCPTRWTVRNETFNSILQNYSTLLELLELWEAILDDKPDSEVRAKVNGIDSQMKTFQFYFGVCLLHSVLSQTDNLSKTLQHTTFSAAEGQQLVKMTTTTLQSIRSEEMFKLFWQKTVIQANALDIEEPTLPRVRKAPRRYEVGSSSGVSPLSPENHYRTIYYETIDTIIACIGNRFEQEGYQMYSKLEQMLVNDRQSEVDKDEVLKFFGSDFEKATLLTQLHLFHSNYRGYSADKRTCIHDIVSLVKDMSVGEKVLIDQVMKLIRLVLVMPATNAISERSFSAMRRIKTYLRSTMSQARLNAAMVLHVHKHLTDSLDLKSICKHFISKSDYRKSVFCFVKFN